MELVNQWSHNGKLRKVDTPFITDSTYEKELIAALQLAGNDLHREEIEYNGKFGHTLGRIQHISLMSRIDILTQPFVYQPNRWHLLFLV